MAGKWLLALNASPAASSGYPKDRSSAALLFNVLGSWGFLRRLSVSSITNAELRLKSWSLFRQPNVLDYDSCRKWNTSGVLHFFGKSISSNSAIVGLQSSKGHVLSKPGAEAPSRLVPPAGGELIDLLLETWNNLVFFWKQKGLLRAKVDNDPRPRARPVSDMMSVYEYEIEKKETPNQREAPLDAGAWFWRQCRSPRKAEAKILSRLITDSKGFDVKCDLSGALPCQIQRLCCNAPHKGSKKSDFDQNSNPNLRQDLKKRRTFSGLTATT